ncbi:MAG: UDP-2,3-diacylglucosamine diphosphatase [Gammaproteobacteria bacterium]|jgi:UDP-2,3-diacylglucosamine pyrophosphatase LpxH|nr:UDP-2,3-diacylglucosamine diphosphatase [Gammaproteobacteria bacterium]
MRFRTVWISDVHLGSRSCQAEALLAFLATVDCDRLYLVGDIVDLIAMRRSAHWPAAHSRVLRALLDLSRSGVELTYIPGNHDEDFRALVGSKLESVPIHRRFIHTTAAGKRLLVVHGDELDAELHCGGSLRFIGALSYRALMRLHGVITRFRRWLGLPYWSLAAEVKGRVATAVDYIQRFESGMIQLAQRADVDGVVCGHIHQPAVKSFNGTLYCNDGDWVESCSALVEHTCGKLEVVRWRDLEAQALARNELQAHAA